jgi:membrane protease YdiL (CAAX protease family)
MNEIAAVPDISPDAGTTNSIMLALLHLMPGAVQVTAFVLLAPAMMKFGWPAGLAFTAVNVFVGIPLMLGYLLYQGKLKNGRPTLSGVIHYREPMPLWQYAALFLLLLGVAFAVLFLTSPINEYLSGTVFSGLPDYFKSSTATSYGEAVGSLLLVMLILQLVVDGFAVPIVEELYFRGHLLPRLSYLGWAAPLFNAFFFTVQHFWQPYNYLLIFLIQVPLVYVVWRKKNIYIGMLAHCAGNTIGALLTLIGFLYS